MLNISSLGGCKAKFLHSIVQMKNEILHTRVMLRKLSGVSRQLLGVQANCKNTPLEDFKVIKLDSKSLIKLSGNDVNPFLQGLITNDIEQLTQANRSIYSMLLNVKGRVLCDLLLYKDVDQSVIVEVDETQGEMLLKLLKKYKIRKKVTIEEISSSHSVYCALGCQNETPFYDGIRVYRDPRLVELGWRIISHSSTGLSQLPVLNESVYKERRYELGVGEGPEEHLPEKALPLESNLALLNGVSFSKGCYIGQELTARSHHTGVIRKRITPVRLEKSSDLDPYIDVRLQSSDKSVGVMRGCINDKGIALLRLNNVFKGEGLYVTDKSGHRLTLTVDKPIWWPSDLNIE